jgi:hypothetical protein
VLYKRLLRKNKQFIQKQCLSTTFTVVKHSLLTGFLHECTFRRNSDECGSAFSETTWFNLAARVAEELDLGGCCVVQILPWGGGTIIFVLFVTVGSFLLLQWLQNWGGGGCLRVVSRGSVVRVYNVLKRRTNSLWFYECNSLYSDRRHASATHVAIFRAVCARIQIYL